MTPQQDVVAFLSDPASYDPPPRVVERIDTHGAHVFLAGEFAWKIKREVAFDYMDFSTLELRRKAIEREFEVNAPNAPDLYLGVVPIRRGNDGHLSFSGAGQVVEYALQMHRFEQSELLSERFSTGLLPASVAIEIADAVYRYHSDAVPHWDVDVVLALSRIIDEIDAAFTRSKNFVPQTQRNDFRVSAQAALANTGDVLRARAKTGHVRRCHGDLHLRNIVMRNGHPVMFDALEFNEELATIDTLYDLAFLLMDVDRAGQRKTANMILNRYLWRSEDQADLEGLRALPLFLALRAAIRAMVSLQRAERIGTGNPGSDRVEAKRYLKSAIGYLSPPPPCLVAVGGFSGTGKSTLASSLAPLLGAAPGALHVRSDLERKAMHHVEETERLPADAYTQAVSDKVYARMLAKARTALASGHAIVIDAVFSKPEERAEVEDLAIAAGVPFEGLWLAASPDVLAKRVGARTGDASDATPDVVAQQVQRGSGTISWQSIDAGGTPVQTLVLARQALRAAGLIPC